MGKNTTEIGTEDNSVVTTLRITFKSDRILTADELDDLVCTLSAQVEEPQTRVTDPAQMDIWMPVTYSTSDIEVAVCCILP